MHSLVFGHRLKETPFQTSGACYLHSSSCPVLSSAKAKCWTLPELQSLCPQLCETSCSVWLPCSALGFGNCFQESWAVTGFILFLPPCLRDQSPVLLALQHLKAVFHNRKRSSLVVPDGSASPLSVVLSFIEPWLIFLVGREFACVWYLYLLLSLCLELYLLLLVWHSKIIEGSDYMSLPPSGLPSHYQILN